MTDVSFAKENRVYPDIIKRYQDNRAKALAEQERICQVLDPDVLELVAKVTDEKTKAELNGFVKVYLTKNLALN